MMKKTKLESDLFYYGNYLELIGSFSLSKHLTLNDLGDTPEDKAVIQKCYRDMKKGKFDGTVIDYLCYISSKYIFTLWYNESDKDYKKDEDSLIFRAFRDYMAYIVVPELKSEFNKNSNIDLDSTALWLLLLLISYENPIHTKNMLRLFKKNPGLFATNDIVQEVMNETEDKFKVCYMAFNMMNVLSFYDFLCESMIAIHGEEDLKKLEYPWKKTAWELTLTYAYKSVIVIDDGSGIQGMLAKKLTKYKKEIKPKKNK